MAKSPKRMSKDKIPAFKTLITTAALAGTLSGWAVIALSAPPVIAAVSSTAIVSSAPVIIQVPSSADVQIVQLQSGLRTVNPVRQVRAPRVVTRSSR